MSHDEQTNGNSHDAERSSQTSAQTNGSSSDAGFDTFSVDHVPEEAFSAYLDDELTSEQRSIVVRYLESHPESRQLVEDLENVRESLALAFGRHQLPTDFSQQVLRTAERRMLEPETDAPADAAAQPTTAANQSNVVLDDEEPPQLAGDDASNAARPFRESRWRRSLAWAGLATAVAVMLMIMSPEPPPVALAPESPPPAPAGPRETPSLEAVPDPTSDKAVQDALVDKLAGRPTQGQGGGEGTTDNKNLRQQPGVPAVADGINSDRDKPRDNLVLPGTIRRRGDTPPTDSREARNHQGTAPVADEGQTAGNGTPENKHHLSASNPVAAKPAAAPATKKLNQTSVQPSLQSFDESELAIVSIDGALPPVLVVAVAVSADAVRDGDIGELLEQHQIALDDQTLIAPQDAERSARRALAVEAGGAPVELAVDAVPNAPAKPKAPVNPEAPAKPKARRENAEIIRANAKRTQAIVAEYIYVEAPNDKLAAMVADLQARFSTPQVLTTGRRDSTPDGAGFGDLTLANRSSNPAFRQAEQFLKSVAPALVRAKKTSEKQADKKPQSLPGSKADVPAPTAESVAKIIAEELADRRERLARKRKSGKEETAKSYAGRATRIVSPQALGSLEVVQQNAIQGDGRRQQADQPAAKAPLPKSQRKGDNKGGQAAAAENRLSETKRDPEGNSRPVDLGKSVEASQQPLARALIVIRIVPVPAAASQAPAAASPVPAKEQPAEPAVKP